MIKIRSLADVEFPTNSDGLYSEKVEEGKLRTTFRFDVDEVRIGYNSVLEVVKEVCRMQCHVFGECKPRYSRPKRLGVFPTDDLDIIGEHATTNDCLLCTGMIPRHVFEER